MSLALLILSAAVLVAGAVAAGCGTDDVGPMSRMVGGRCTSNGDCVHRCATTGEFPGGYCTVGCASNRDCPGGSACVTNEGGICLATCQVAADCEGYGPGYQCNRLTSPSAAADPLACVGG